MPSPIRVIRESGLTITINHPTIMAKDGKWIIKYEPDGTTILRMIYRGNPLNATLLRKKWNSIKPSYRCFTIKPFGAGFYTSMLVEGKLVAGVEVEVIIDGHFDERGGFYTVS